MIKLFGRGKGPNPPKKDQELQDDRVIDVVMQMSGISAEQMQPKPERRRSAAHRATDETLMAARMVS